MTDPSLQYLESCPRIDTPRFTGKNPERQEKEWKYYRMAQLKNLPSPSSNVNEKKSFEGDLQNEGSGLQGISKSANVTSRKKSEPRQCHSNALFIQRLKRKMDDEFARVQAQQAKLKEKAKKPPNGKAAAIDMKDLRGRAAAYSKAAPQAHVYITHQGRTSKI